MALASYTNLAYLIEISVVLNLAFRELKFPDLYEKKLKKSIAELRSLAKQEKITTNYINTDLDIFASLETGEKGKNDGLFSLDLWGDKKSLEKFYTKYILNGFALAIVNFSILFNVLTLILITAFSSVVIGDLWSKELIIQSLVAAFIGLTIPPLFCYLCDTIKEFYLSKRIFFILLLTTPILIISGLAMGFEITFVGQHLSIDVSGSIVDHSRIWVALFGFLTSLTLIPIYFIIMSTKCEEFFYGNGKEDIGMIEKIKKDLLSKRMNTNKETVEDARSLNVDDNIDKK